jgi:UDP-N-acetyl-D-glucosamine dehydrogenase
MSVEEAVCEKVQIKSTTELIKKLKNKTATIGIVGLGYVGMPLVLRYNEVGYKVLGLDINAETVSLANEGKTEIEHIDNEKIVKAKSSGFRATEDYKEIRGVDAIILCVPTPLNIYREPDLSYVESTIDSLLPHLHAGQLISLESTSYPGTTDEIVKRRIESAGFKTGKDIFIVYSPEREDPGRETHTTQTIPKICSGCTDDCLAAGMALYQAVIDEVVPVSSPKVAEMTKLLENIHRNVNIGLVNEMKIVADHMGIDIYEVIRAASTKPFGFVPYWPGPGVGGHCIPIDPFYLTWKAREYGLHTRFIELAGEINNAMPKWVVNRTTEALNDFERPIKGSRILILGVAYKKNVDDMRESPSLKVMQLLQKKGAILDYSDPHVLQMPKMRLYEFNLSSVTLTPEKLQQYDCVVLLTAHSKFNFEMIREHSRLIIDTRGVYPGNLDNIVKA